MLVTKGGHESEDGNKTCLEKEELEEAGCHGPFYTAEQQKKTLPLC